MRQYSYKNLIGKRKKVEKNINFVLDLDGHWRVIFQIKRGLFSNLQLFYIKS
jgi:hypothetical protein